MSCAEHAKQSAAVFGQMYSRWLAMGAPAPNPRPPVIWLELNACSGDTIALMNTQKPNLGMVMQRLVDFRYANALLGAQGKEALQSMLSTAVDREGEFLLIIEGAIPLKDNGLYTIVAEAEQRLTAEQIVRFLGPRAKYVVAAGTCACYGGPSAATPNLSGSVGVRDVLDRRIVNVAGCPNNPDWIMGTLFHLLFYGEPELDNDGRPLLFYRDTVHRHCQRRSYFDNNEFADALGDIECMFRLGCMGPVTPSDCPYRQWNGYVNWPVRANTPCIGCTTVRFPDGSSPFFRPLPEKGTPLQTPPQAPPQPADQKPKPHASTSKKRRARKVRRMKV